MSYNSESYTRQFPEHSKAADLASEAIRRHEGANFFELSRMFGDDTVLIAALGLLWTERKIRTNPEGEPDLPFDNQPYRVKGWKETVRFFTAIAQLNKDTMDAPFIAGSLR